MIVDAADWPLFGWTTDIRAMLANAREEERSVVLATLVRSIGPTPRPVGTQMVFKGSRAHGYFSGGCLEADVANHAADVAESGISRSLLYGDGSPWIDIRLLCGGTLEILLERIDPDDPATGALLQMSARREQARWASDGATRSVLAASDAGRPIFDGKRYTLSYTPRWRIMVVGDDPVALAIANLAAISGFDTTLVRPFGPTTPPPIANIAYLRSSAKDAIVQMNPDRWTAIISATHDDDDADDDVVVTQAAFSTAYIGVLGSAQRVTARRRRLAAAGLTDAQIDLVRAPIGIARCGKAPWEVAVSVIAEVMQLRAARSADVPDSLRHDGSYRAAIDCAA